MAFLTRIAATLLGVASVAGCSATSSRAGLSISGSPSGYGQDAYSLAAAIVGCSPVVRITLAAPAARSAQVASTCPLLGHQVVLYTWPDARGESAATDVLSRQGSSYYADGIGWTAIVGDAAPLDVQRRIATSVAASLHGRVERVA